MLTKEASTKPLTASALLRRMASDAIEVRTRLVHEPDPDTLAQSIVCAAPILAAAQSHSQAALPWLLHQLAPWEQIALDQATVLSTQYSVLSTLNPLDAHNTATLPSSPSSPSLRPSVPLSHSSTLARSHSSSPAHLYELFLHHYSKPTRKRHGVFFTPEPLAIYIVSQIDRLLRDHFNLRAGLASHSAPGYPLRGSTPNSALPLLLDPACGTGIFLLSVIDHIHRRIPAERWNAFVPNLLARLIGIEILPAAALLAKLNIALKLAETGYDFATPAKIQILTGDALSSHLHSEFCILNSQIPVLLGNPPFSSLSTNTNPWIARLVRGDDEIRGYIRANGQQLGERKTWLHDDYVKFIRLAQWHVEQAGAGIVGFVTNHGYLDNATFRLMRHELLRVFPHIQILDLHGNRRARGAGVSPALPTRCASEGVSSSVATDENIFHLDQGTAIGIFCRPPATLARSASEGNPPSLIEYADLWGSRATKLSALANASFQPRAISPRAPDYRFIPTPATTSHPEYDSAWSLADAMPVHATAPVTARDHFVVAFTREELIARLEEFRDLKIPDDRIRHRYFTRTRSARYQTGDTRSWKLTQARRTIAADPAWREKIIRCLYRPFDWRYIFWHPALIDWPRTEITRHLIDERRRDGETEGTRELPDTMPPPSLPLSFSPSLRLALLARRQQLPTQPCTFFWIADCLPLDGVIRSDNRGSESLFPLYLNPAASTWNLGPETWNLSPNFAPAFIDHIATATKLTWLPHSSGELEHNFGPTDLLAYIYANFHSPTYRTLYADSLRNDFPRILPPRNQHQFAQLSRFGHELINLHLLRTPLSPSPFLPLSPSVASFRAGGYPALQKWLQPPHRSPTDPDYARIASAIARTLQITPAIDQVFTGS